MKSSNALVGVKTTKQFLILILLAFFSSYSIAQQKTAVVKTAPAVLQDFMDQRFGMFIHWGPVNLRGTEIGWSRGNGVDTADYDNLYKEFNPVLFNAEAWVLAAKNAGMKYLTITAKHHDGFCLWPSKFTDYDIMSSPYKKDILDELSKACLKHGIKFCVYFTLLDWHDPLYPISNIPNAGLKSTGDMRKLVDKIKGQLTEIVKGYHPYMLWFDGNWEAPWTLPMGQEIYAHLKQLDPKVIVNNRLGKGTHKIMNDQTVGDYATPEQYIGEINMKDPWESCITICNQWAWKPNDKMKTLKESLHTLAGTAGGNGNLLYNVGPMADGRVEQRQVKMLSEMGKWLMQYGVSIYGTRGGPYLPSKDLVATRKGSKVYIHLLKTNATNIALPNLPTKQRLSSVRYLNGPLLAFQQDEFGISIPLTGKLPDLNNTVLVLDFVGDVTDVPLVF
jgi:alpha-L-fucosidase